MSGEDVRQFFTRHAGDYRTSASHAAGTDLDLLIELSQPRPDDRLIDVAAGTGHTALRLRPLVASALLVDLTPAMLEEARALAAEQGLLVETMVADAAAIARPDGAFTLLTCRRAAHHFLDLPAFLAEAHRLLAPGGRLALADMTAEEAGIDLLNRLERMRDRSHVAALSPEAWRGLLIGHGFTAPRLALQEEPYSLQRWLSPTGPGEVDMPAIEASLAEASEGERRALGLRHGPEGWQLTKRRLVLVAERAAG